MAVELPKDYYAAIRGGTTSAAKRIEYRRVESWDKSPLTVPFEVALKDIKSPCPESQYHSETHTIAGKVVNVVLPKAIEKEDPFILGFKTALPNEKVFFDLGIGDDLHLYTAQSDGDGLLLLTFKATQAGNLRLRMRENLHHSKSVSLPVVAVSSKAA